MSIAELTAKIERLSKEDYNIVISLVDRLSENTDNIGLKKLSEDELVKELTESIQKSNQGQTKAAKDVSARMRNKYAI